MSHANYAGKQAYDQGGASFHMEPGPEPSHGSITILSEDAQNIAFNPSGHTLEFYDHDNSRIDVQHIFVESVSDAEPGLVTLGLVDSRCFWKYRTGSWILNLTYDDNTKYNTKTINGSSPWTFGEIIRKFGETLCDTPSGAFKPIVHYSPLLDNISITLKNINYECMPAAEAMQSCLNIVGGFVSIDFNGNVWVCMPGDKAPDIDSSDGSVERLAWGESVNNTLAKPEYLKLKYRILREKKFTKEYWEPVMQYPPTGPDGTAYTGDEHGRSGEWGTVNAVLTQLGYSEELIKANYFRLSDYLDIKSNKRLSQFADDIHAQFYKYFRFKGPLTTSEEAREQILPFHSTLATFGRVDTDEKHTCAAYAENTYGLYATEQNSEGAIINHYVDPFCVSIVDQNQGIIKFDTALPVCKYIDYIPNGGKAETDYELGEIDINVWVAYIKKFVSSAGLTDDYYIPTNGASGTGYLDKWSGVKSNGETLEMLVEDTYYVEQYDGSGWNPINYAEIDNVSAAIAEDYFGGYKENDRPKEVTRFEFDSKYVQLYANLKYISLIVDTSQGGIQKLKFNDDMPINPFSRNLIDELGDLQGVGNSYRIGSKKRLKIKSRGGRISYDPDSIKFTGLMSHCADYGKRGADIVLRAPNKLINANNYGILVGEDWSEGETGKCNHSWKCRVDGYDDFHPNYTLIGKSDDCYHHVRGMWEPRLVAEPNERGATGNSPLVQEQINPTTTSGSQTAASASTQAMGNGGTSNQDTSGGGISVPVPGPTPGSGKTKKDPNAKTGKGISTYVWDRSDEIGPSDKGPLNDVLQVGSHRQKSKDPDGNNICQLEIDLDVAKHHCTDECCGELNHLGKFDPPKPRGIQNDVKMYYREDLQKWDWVCWNIGGGCPPGPVPTPVPVPTPTPGTPTPGPGEPPPVPGGPTTTPEPGPSEPPAPAPSPVPGGGSHGSEETGTGVKTTWGRKAPQPGIGNSANDPNAPPPPIIEQPPGTNENPDPDFPDFPPIPGTGVVEECRAYNPDLEREVRRPLKLKNYTGGSMAHPIHPPIVGMGDMRSTLPWFSNPEKLSDYEWTAGGSHYLDPYLPGTQIHPNAVRPYERPDPYIPGTGQIAQSVINRFNLDGQPTSFDWDADSLAEERTTDKQWKLFPTISDTLVSALDKINAASGRIEYIHATELPGKLATASGPGAPGQFITVDGKTISYNAGGQLTAVV